MRKHPPFTMSPESFFRLMRSEPSSEQEALTTTWANLNCLREERQREAIRLERLSHDEFIQVMCERLASKPDSHDVALRNAVGRLQRSRAAHREWMGIAEQRKRSEHRWIFANGVLVSLLVATLIYFMGGA